MIRPLLAGAAALTLMTGAAYAQDSTYYSNTRTVTQTTPFGSSRTVTTTTSQAPQPLPYGASGDDYDSAVADLPPAPAAPPPNYAPPPDYARSTTTTQYGPNGVETQRTDRYQSQQGLYDPNGELSTHTTTTRTNSMTYGPPTVYTPNPATVGPSPTIDMPPRPYGQTTVITHSTTDE